MTTKQRNSTGSSKEYFVGNTTNNMLFANSYKNSFENTTKTKSPSAKIATNKIISNKATANNFDENSQTFNTEGAKPTTTFPETNKNDIYTNNIDIQQKSQTVTKKNSKLTTITYNDFMKKFLEEQKKVTEKPVVDEHLDKKIIAVSIVFSIFLVLLIMILKDFICEFYHDIMRC